MLVACPIVQAYLQERDDDDDISLPGRRCIRPQSLVQGLLIRNQLRYKFPRIESTANKLCLEPLAGWLAYWCSLCPLILSCVGLHFMARRGRAQFAFQKPRFSCYKLVAVNDTLTSPYLDTTTATGLEGGELVNLM